MRAPRIVAGIDWILEIVTGEYLLTRRRHANGGTIVFLRAVHVAVATFALGLGLVNVVDPRRTWGFSFTELRLQIIGHATWFGTVFAAAYVAFYARFASQWNYLAGVYNQIKAAQARGEGDKLAIAQWRAGFIEDCDDLHLLRKPMFASIAADLLSSTDEECERVRQVFDDHTPGGANRRNRIAAEATLVVKTTKDKYAVEK
jgi:hypothetical protein